MSLRWVSGAQSAPRGDKDGVRESDGHVLGDEAAREEVALWHCDRG